MTKDIPRHLSNALRQERIVQAALSCFTQKGIEQTAMGDICQHAGVSVGSVYHHFGSKEALAGTLYCEAIRRFQQGYLRALKEAGDARAVIAALVGYHLDWVVTQPLWARYLLQTRSSALDAQAAFELEQLNVDFLATMASWFGEQVRAGQVRRLPREIYVAMLVGPCQEWARSYLKGHVGAPDPALRQALAASVWRALCMGSPPISDEQEQAP